MKKSATSDSTYDPILLMNFKIGNSKKIMSYTVSHIGMCQIIISFSSAAILYN